jgi:hypothetical protein
MAYLLHSVTTDECPLLRSHNIMTVQTIESIPSKFIQDYIDQLLNVAKGFPEDSIMRAAVMRRVECIMDMVDAYKKVYPGLSK